MVAGPAQAASPAPPAVSPALAPAPPPPPPQITPPGASVPIQIPPGVVPPATLEALQGRGIGGTVYHVLDDKQVELTPVGAEIQTSTIPVIGYQKSELVLPGNKAGYRKRTGNRSFSARNHRARCPLCASSPAAMTATSSSDFSRLPFVGTTQRHGVRAEDRIDVEADRDARGFYRIRPRKPLEPGRAHGRRVEAVTVSALGSASPLRPARSLPCANSGSPAAQNYREPA